MIEWIIRVFNPPKLTLEERQQAVMFRELMMGGEIFELDNKGTEKLVRQYGMPVREFNGTRHDN